MDSKRDDIGILVACRRTITCELYSRTLNRHAGFQVEAIATSADEILRSTPRAGIHVALISTALRDGPVSGLSVLQSLQESSPGIKSILLFDPEESHLVVPAFRAGARGVFCAGQGDFKSLCRCVERVHAGQVWANSAELSEVLDTFAHDHVTRIVDADGLRLLTKREEEVTRLIREGLTNREIACQLHLSEHTVRNNLFRIFDKLGVSNRVELAIYRANVIRMAPEPSPGVGDLAVNDPKRKLPTSTQEWNRLNSRRDAG